MQIKKASYIHGTDIRFRNVEVSDAAFILSLRLDETRNKFISSVSPSLADQESYLEKYSKSEGEAYFIIEADHIGPIGTIRLYDQRGSSFCWGSWIVAPGAPARTGSKSAVLLYIYAFDTLGFSSSHFDVRQGNESVWRFHERFGAELTHEDELDRFYTLPRSAWERTKPRYEQYIPSGKLDFKLL
ncbi:RimJ/RimL family protein N-acetyltransferase [Phyllobacterium myrsinacearum]|uniref:GNAT family N-acetyltransferase n=1 Tax=Phyllobacterium myrsinacearum TaxID=28101 RepID=UPI001028B35C|nr:RimJ/RimL family protein N-acetyltransferase [Phyllobacterium myrsinacearum]